MKTGGKRLPGRRGGRQGLDLKPAAVWAPSQKGFFRDRPQRHSVTRFRLSYLTPSADSMGTPPLTQMGPLLPASGFSIRLIEGSSSSSMASPVVLSQATRLPDGQAQASSTAAALAAGSSDRSA